MLAWENIIELFHQSYNKQKNGDLTHYQVNYKAMLTTLIIWTIYGIKHYSDYSILQGSQFLLNLWL